MDANRRATASLLPARDGDPQPARQFVSAVCTGLPALADRFFRGQPADHTLLPPALVHEPFHRGRFS